MESDYVEVARASELSDGRSKLVKVGDLEIAVWRVDGKFYAVNNVCPHQHFSTLHQGTLEGLNLTCPMHGWTYSLETGEATTGNGRAKVYSVKVDGDRVFIRLRDGMV
jgi:3-phenylpropionate/trans-cinnamate dioxygenase ferredoxin subunit